MPAVFIYGSCVSRDTRPYLGEGWEITKYVARQSMISAASPRGVLRGESALTSKFQNECLRNDIRSSLFSAVDEAKDETDVFVIDLVDERLGVYEIEDGTYVSHSWELEESKLLKQQDRELKHIPFGTDEHFNLWAKSAKTVIAKLKSTGKPVLVLGPEWSEKADDGQAPLMYRGKTSAAYNDLYRRYYDHLRALGVNVLSIGQDTVMASVQHQWGLAPYHYVKPVYHLMRDAITSAIK